MEILLNFESVLLELSLLVRYKLAAVLKIDHKHVHLRWRLGGAGRVFGPLSRIVGLSDKVVGDLVPVIVIEDIPELKDIPKREIDALIGVMIDRMRPDAIIRLAAIQERWVAHGEADQG